MSELSHQLANPSQRLRLDGLAEVWCMAKIAVRVPGCAGFAHDLHLLRRVRGGIGTVLLESASEAAVAGRPCPWTPPCALDVFFREQGRFGAHGIPKPYVLATDRRGPDLVVTMTLFGIAVDWAAVMTHALVGTLRFRIDWHALRDDIFVPRIALEDISVQHHQGLRPRPRREHAEVEFLTPMNAERDDPVGRPATLFARLARRIEGLALWHDVALDEDWRGLGVSWNDVEYDVRGLRTACARRRSGGTQTSFHVPTVSGTLWVHEVTSELWSLLALGAETHVGKGATEGFGRYALG